VDDWVAIDLDRLAEVVPGRRRSTLAAESALRVLEHAGYLAMEQPGVARLVTPPGDPRGRLSEVDFDGVAAREAHERTLLRRMLDYAYATSCRHMGLLGYFGDRTHPGECHACDNCERARAAPANALDEAQRTDVLKVLSCVARMRGRFGKQRVAQVLMGSRAREVTNLGLDQLSTHGLLRDRGRDEVLELLQACIDAGYVTVVGSEYPLVELTEAGHEAVRGRRDLNVRHPGHARVAVKAQAAPDTPASAPAQPASPAPPRRDDLGADDRAVFERLRRLRADLASAEGVPPYVVFHDRVLVQMVTRRPTTLAELRAIPGVGDHKLARYGARFLDVLIGGERPS
jgi:ATP-dependent DNA helicase RecQ